MSVLHVQAYKSCSRQELLLLQPSQSTIHTHSLQHIDHCLLIMHGTTTILHVLPEKSLALGHKLISIREWNAGIYEQYSMSHMSVILLFNT